MSYTTEELIKSGAESKWKTLTLVHTDSKIVCPDIERLKSLLDYGVDINLTNNELNVLMMLLRYADLTNNINIIKFLIDNGIDLKTKTYDGWSALLLAARYCPVIEIIELILQNYDNINDRNADGLSALILVAMNRAKHDQDLVKKKITLLLSYGVDPNIKDKDGMTAFDSAEDKSVFFGQITNNLCRVKKLINNDKDSKCLECNICFLNNKDCSISVCGHTACSDCIDGLFKDITDSNKEVDCPMCRTKFTKNHLTRFIL